MAPVLGYWSARGLTQPIRYLLTYTGTQYEDELYDFGPAPDFSRSAWLSVKENLGLEFPNMPYYIDGSVKITESEAILRYLARKNDLAGSTEEDRIRIDMASGILRDIFIAIAMICYNEKFEDLKGGFIADINTPLKKLSTLLGTGDYITGAKISFVDFVLFETLERHEALAPGCLSKFKNLVDFHKRFVALPAIKSYLASPSFKKIEDRFNAPQAKFGAGTY